MDLAVDDPDDPRLADYRQVRDRDLLRADTFLAEGRLVVHRLLASPIPVRSVLVSQGRRGALGPVPDQVPVYVVPDPLMRTIIGFDLHRGIVAAAARPAPREAGELLGDPAVRRVAVLEALNDHENLGVIFRAASALGMDAVLLCPRCADPWYRRTVRVSMGQVLAVPFARLTPWPDGLAAVRRAGFQLLAMTPRAGSVELGCVQLGDTDRVAVLLGAEGPGLSEGALAAADRVVRIPMRPGVDSLGVASAASIAFHRLGRV